MRGWLTAFASDLRRGARVWRRSPGFAAVIIVTLALATGATTAIFSIVHAVLLRPLPFADPDRLVEVFGRVWRDDRGRDTPDPLNAPVGSLELEAYGEQSHGLEALAGYSVTTVHLDAADGVERLMAVRADRTLFDVLGVDARTGRAFRADDPLDVAVISERLWRRRFDGDPAIAGRVVILDGQPFTILGVAPASFQFPYSAASIMPGALPEARTDLWIPLPPLRASADGALRQGRVSVVGRLAPGTTLEAATAELRLIAQRIESGLATESVRVGVRLAPLAAVVVGPARGMLWLLLVAAGLVLAAACANVATLLLTRMTLRMRDVVTRAALGANRLRLIREFLAESLILAVAGGLIGAVLASVGSTALVALGSEIIPRAHEVGLDWQTFAFLFASVVVVALLFGVAPAATVSRADAQAALSGAGRTTTGRGQARVRDALVMTEIALAFVLAMAALLVVREAKRLYAVDTGMVTDNVLTLHVSPRASAQDYMEIEQRLKGMAGVHAAGFTQLLPLQNWGWESGFAIAGRDPAERPVAGLRYVTPGYFAALGIPITRGRGLNERDDENGARVILINEALARRYFPDQDPIGVETDRGTIAGVVGNVNQTGPGMPAMPELYYPVLQNVTMAPDIGMTLVVSASGSPEALSAALRVAVREVNPGLAVFNVRTMERVLADSLWQLRLQQWLIGLYAILTLVVATIGLYGVTAYSVQSRVRELAVRLALGCDTSGLTRLILSRSIRLALAGLIVGGPIVLVLGPILASVSPGVRADAGAFAIVVPAVLAIALASCLIPAARVAAVEPSSVLRHD
ncbi:MAG: ABC transporter permease [Gemmatimonadetes bacterium]|nr:ABC transporter permease [Gemmatimonadota bacterium]